MKLRTLSLCLLMTLCNVAVRADSPSLGAYGNTDMGAGAATPAGAAQSKCKAPCYDQPNGCISTACANFDQANPGFFNNIDASCGLPSGTALTFGQIESSCNPAVAGSTGTYRGLFQFSASSCPGVNLHDASAQASCLCSSTSMWRNKYFKQTGQNPSAGMYYLFHQQGGCGIKLALGGGARAVDVVSQCVSSTKCGGSGGCAASMKYAMAAIGGNIPGTSGLNVNTVTAAQFANTYLAKFAKVDDSNMCLSETLTPGTGAAAGMAAGTGALNQGGNLLTNLLVQAIMSQDISSIFSPVLNPKYDEDDGASGEEPVKTKVTVTTNSDGSKSVKVEKGDDTTTYSVKHGQQLWECDGEYKTVAVTEEAAMVYDKCTKVTEVAEKPVKAK